METGGGGENTGKARLPKSSWRESGKLETAAGTKLKQEKGEGLNSINTVNKESAESATPQLDTWQCCGGKGESAPSPQEQSGVQEVLGPHGEKRFHCWKDIGRDC